MRDGASKASGASRDALSTTRKHSPDPQCTVSLESIVQCSMHLLSDYCILAIGIEIMNPHS